MPEDFMVDIVSSNNVVLQCLNQVKNTYCFARLSRRWNFLFNIGTYQGGDFGSGRSGISGKFRVGSEFGRQDKANLVGEFG